MGRGILHGRVLHEHAWCVKYAYRLMRLRLKNKCLGLVAMRVHALFGGGSKIKVFLWISWIIYAGATLFLLWLGLSEGQRE